MRLAPGPLLLLLLLGLATACGSKDESSTPADASFEGVPWVLASGIDVGGWEQNAPSAEFAHGTVGGSTGCNRYTAPYTVDGDALEIGTVAATKMACPPPGNLVETSYTAALSRVAGWKLEDEQLVLVDDNDGPVLTYDAASPVGDWEATAVQTGTALESPPAGSPITASFGDDGKLTGSGGCNSYSSTYTTDRGGIEITEPVATRMACADERVMELETAYLAALPTATHYRVDGHSLSLLRADGTFVASYARRP